MTNLQVIWAIGWGMLLLSGLIFLPKPILLSIGILAIVFHNLSDYLPQTYQSFWLALFLRNSIIEPISGLQFRTAYPILPWLGIMLMGYCMGNIFLLSPEASKRRLLNIALIFLLIFIMVRSNNGYGSPSKWFFFEDNLFTLLSFINCSKYPPSLCFILMTLSMTLFAS